LAKIVLNELKRKKNYLRRPPEGKIKPEQLHVSVSRSGWCHRHGTRWHSIPLPISIADTHTAKKPQRPCTRAHWPPQKWIPAQNTVFSRWMIFYRI